MRSVIDQFENYAKLNKRLPAETGIQLGEIEDPSALADAIASNLSIKVADKQALLAELHAARRLEMVFAFMEGELGVLQVEKKIRSRVKRQMEKTQREYYLNEQLKAIQRELGNESEEGGDELQELAEKIRKTRFRRKPATGPIRSSKSSGRWRRCPPRRRSRATISTSCSACRGARNPSSRRISPKPKGCSTRTITGSTRSRTGSSNISRSRRAPTSSRARSCASSARRASARPRSAAPSPAPRAANSSASHWAACATKPRSAAIAGPISARSRARSSQHQESGDVHPSVPAR